MPVYQLTQDQLIPINETDFESEGIYERKDIQRLLKAQIDVLDEGLLVIAEEFGGWIDSRRSIDLLCVDRDANLVVVELKRTEDGGHMELQAIRYAAMVSSMTFPQMIETFARFLNRTEPDIEAAEKTVLQFLDWQEADEDSFGQETRILLAAADFGKELTTAVMWLNERGLDIQCIRLKLYKTPDGSLLLDVQTIIPLPEIASFQTQIGVKRQAERQQKTKRHDLRYRFWGSLLSCAKTRTDIHANRSPSQNGWVSGGIGRVGFALTYATRQSDCQVELGINIVGQKDKNKEMFRKLLAQKDEIEKDFGGPLDWQELSDGVGCRIRKILPDGGYRSPPSEWSDIHKGMVDAMIALDLTMRPRVAALPA